MTSPDVATDKFYEDLHVLLATVSKADNSIAPRHSPVGHSWKIFARLLLNRLNNHLERGLLPESQCGFRRRRGTTDMICVVRQLQVKCQEVQIPLYFTFLYMPKAFVTVDREGLWQIMQKVVHELFADHCALSVTYEEDMQGSKNLFPAGCDNFGLLIDTEKTVFTHQLPPDSAYLAPQINVDDAQLQAVDNFTYLGSTLFRNTKIGDGVLRRFSEAIQALCVCETQFKIDTVSTSAPCITRTS
nr:unnamed protein product [Spirometra erinaceieuropaei]